MQGLGRVREGEIRPQNLETDLLSVKARVVKGGSGFLRGKGASSKPENRTGVNLGQKDDPGLDLLHLCCI